MTFLHPRRARPAASPPPSRYGQPWQARAETKRLARLAAIPPHLRPGYTSPEQPANEGTPANDPPKEGAA